MFAVSIYNDNIAECDKILILNISALTCGVVIGRNDTSNITIRDDDGRRSVSDYIVLFIATNVQEQCCHLTNHNIPLKRTLLHYQLV